MISVCLTTYNGGKYLAEQLSSILCQLSEHDEVIISDDGSSDNTIQIIHSFNDPRIHLLNHTKEERYSNYSFYRITSNFENALKSVKGDLIFLADQDDIWLPGKVKAIKQHIGDYQLVLHDCKIMNESVEIMAESYFAVNQSRIGFVRNLINSSYLGCCMAFKREILDTALPFPSLPVPHDIWIGLIAEFQNNSIFIEEKLAMYRRHDNNMSTSGSSSKFSLLMKIRYRFFLILELIKRLNRKKIS